MNFVRSIPLAFLWPLFIAAVSVAASQQTSISANCLRTCNVLASQCHLATDSPGNGNLTVWDAKQQQVQSACRVLPSSAHDVSFILRTVTRYNCPFAVKGGGHAREPDDSVSVGGVTVDMQRMRSVVVSPDHTRVKLGGGHVLYSVYQGLEKYNLTTLGGSVADVGLGGFALGGGMSRLSPKYGLAMDNVFEYELVLPNATIATINEKSQPDLYFALRGGMNNFGIVTEFTMRAVPKGQVYGGSLTYTADKRSAVLEEAYRLTETWKNDTSMAFYYRFVYDPKANDFTLTVSKEYAYPIMNPAPFAALDRIPSKSSEGRIDWPSRFSMDIISPYGDRNLFATITYSPSVELDRNLQDFLMEEASSIKDVQGFRPNIVIQPLYEAVIRSGKERGGNAAGIDANGPLTLVLFILTWDKAEDDSRINLMAERWLERSNSLTKSVGKHHDWLYINYANKKQDPFAGYGRENHQRLRNIQRQTDPLGIFTSKGLCRGYFKLL